MSIQKERGKINGIRSWLVNEAGERIAIILIVFLVGVSSFGLGRMSVAEPAAEARFRQVDLDSMSASAFQATQQNNDVSSVGQGGEIEGQGMVVASKSGSVYHYPWCPGAKQMKEENKVFYNSIEEARAAGLRPAANCKGLR